MGTITISLSDTLKAFVDEQVSQRTYRSRSEYVCELLQRDKERQQLRELLLAGPESAPASPADEAYFEALRHRVLGPESL